MKKTLALFLFCFLAFIENAHAKSDCGLKLRVLLINAYSTPLAPSLTSRGIEVFHAHTDQKAPEQLSAGFHPEHFIADHAPNSYEEALALVHRLQIDQVIVGSESGGGWASRLNVELGREPRVSEETLVARRDKFPMSERIREHGLRAVTQSRSVNVEDTLNWIAQNNLFEKGSRRVVLKPPMSAGADSVYFCKDEAEVRAAFTKIEESSNLFDLKNDYVLVQEELVGIEYVVNTASMNGHVKITDIWQYVKTFTDDGRKLYGHDLLLDSKGVIQDQLVAYSKEILKALEIHTGWGHIEIIMTKEGPLMVEIGNRMMGANQPAVVTKALGAGQIEYGIAAHLYPDEFHQLPDLYDLKQGAAVVTLNCLFENARFNEGILERIKALPGYVSHSLGHKHGAPIKKTIDLLSSIGHVEIVHEDPVILQQSIDQLERWAREGAFFLPVPPVPFSFVGGRGPRP